MNTASETSETTAVQPTTNVIDDALRRVRDINPRLADTLQREVDALRDGRTFGLVFERHLPESVRLVDYPIKRGVLVSLRHPSKGHENDKWRVLRVEGSGSERKARLLKPGVDGEAAAEEPEPVPVGDLVVVREFGEPVFPGLQRVGEPIRAGNSNSNHVVIEGENFHALQLLRLTHRNAIDVIYIDPPYNTGGKTSWLYNDKYVDKTDKNMSSKWLSFMARRLEIARDLLKDTGVIMVSIGDDEQHRLRMLMDQTFGVKNFVNMLTVEMSTTSGPKTVNAQQGTIVKNCEFVLIYKKTAAFDTQISHTPLYDGIERWDTNYPLWLNDDGTTDSLYDRLDADEAVRADIERFNLTASSGRRRGKFVGADGMDILLTASEAARGFVNANLHRIGRTDTAPVSGRTADVPVGRWVDHVTEGRSYRLTRSASGKVWQIYTLDRNYRTSDDYAPRFGRTVIRGDLWRGFHSDMGHVSNEGAVGFANGKKPIRLIKQLIKWANNSPNTVVLDFFGGSGSTAHAVMSMNAEDGGNRRSILVTNNEVGVERANALKRQGFRQGDSEWEAEGVFESVTRPRITTVATGVKPDGSLYEAASPSNVDFYKLTYLDPDSVNRGREFAAIAPLLWLQAGSPHDRIEERPEDGYAITPGYAVLADTDAAEPFLRDILKAETVPPLAYVVTDSPSEFAHVSGLLPDGCKPIRLYESYLRNFTINVEEA